MRNTLIFIIGLILATWFALTGMIWTYNIALFVAYPSGLFALACWIFIRQDKKWRNYFIPIVLGIGLILSQSVLTCLLITN